MTYKSKKEKDQAVLQFIGNCIVNGMKKSEAVERAQAEFNISIATVYLSIRRCKKRHSLENGGQYGE